MNPCATRQIRLLTYNIHGCVGRNGLEDPEGILEVIRAADADFVALQEVQDRDEADRSFLHGLERLDYAHVIYGQTMRKEAGQYGNILLSKHPLSEIELINISQKQREPRGLIHAGTELFGHSIQLNSTHLGLARHERSFQIAKILALFGMRQKKQNCKVLEILMGDLNEWSLRSINSKNLAQVFRFASTSKTFPARWPVFPLDRILINGSAESVHFSRIDTKLARRVSDHRPLIADIHF